MASKNKILYWTTCNGAQTFYKRTRFLLKMNFQMGGIEEVEAQDGTAEDQVKGG